MASVVWADLTVRVAALSVVDVAIQDDVLAFANTRYDARLYDYGEDDPRLRLIRIYLALHLATGGSANADGSGADGPAGPVTSESCGGLSRSYASLGADDPALGESYWGRQLFGYLRAKKHGPWVF